MKNSDTKYYLEDSFLDIEYAHKKLNLLDDYKEFLDTAYYKGAKKELLDLIDLANKSIAKIHLEELT